MDKRLDCDHDIEECGTPAFKSNDAVYFPVQCYKDDIVIPEDAIAGLSCSFCNHFTPLKKKGE